MLKTVYFLPEKIDMDQAFQLYSDLENQDGGSHTVLNNQRELVRDNKRNDIYRTLKTLPRMGVLVLWDLTQIKDFEKFYYGMLDRRLDQIHVRILNPNYTLAPNEPDCKQFFDGIILLQKSSNFFPTANSSMSKGTFGRVAIPEEKVNLMIKDRQRGMAYAAIAELYGVARSTVQKYVAHVKIEKKESKKIEEEKKTMRFSYENINIGVEVPSEIHSIYKQYLRTKKSDSTRKVYLNDFRKLIAYLKEEKQISPMFVKDLSEQLLFDYFDYLGDQNYKDTYVRRILAGFRAFFSYAMRKGILKSDPSVDIPMPPSDVFEIKTDPLSKREIDRIIDVAKEEFRNAKSEYKKMLAHRNLTLVYLLVSVGMRGGAVLDLRIKNFRFEREVPKLVLKGKGVKSYKVSIDRKTAYLLDDFIQRYLKDADDNDVVFFAKDQTGGSISNSGLNHIVRRFAKTAGIANFSEIRSHSCRVTFATMQDGKMTSKELQKRMGHADIQMTEAYKRIGLNKIENEWLPDIDDIYSNGVSSNA